ncbi:helix-turn-helix domain-containing protein [Planomicrobium sp. MB-3u-38]|uniref:helix-turn-helix domain-containing protein n=1 Tax=Planomicrobium sp. MB-3u-38 TaxID=2058318 RepID=UPI000C798F95|nr:helix-turn-helix transcriptional regulator [Planomicrobium sp. MB-3u-38]PKH11648.1 XRE family transcriptional regulator [Planomicrobium sp. MB-3u-38]
MASLGERIRKLRKERGLTLQALAGEELSKGMLSLIENNKANPSMESLAYIAKQLNIHINELLEEVSPSELREVLQEVENIYLKITDDMTSGFKKIVELVTPFIDQLPYRYESARLLEIYSRCLYYMKEDGWQKHLEQAEEMYEGLHLMNNSADIQLFRAMLKFNDHQYEESLKMLKHSRKVFDERGIILDSLKKLDFDFSEAILHMAIAEDEDALNIIEDAINYSKEHQIFYKIDALYRVTAFHSILNNDEERKNYYIDKLRVFADFTEDPKIDIVLDLLEAHYLNSFKHDFEGALKLIDKNMKKYNDEETSQFYIEKGKALYGMGKLDEALPWLEKHRLWEFMHHPYDLLMNYEKDAYLALIYEEQGRHELAMKHAEIAKNNADPMPDLPYKKFIMNVYNEITSK